MRPHLSVRLGVYRNVNSQLEEPCNCEVVGEILCVSSDLNFECFFGKQSIFLLVNYIDICLFC